VFLQCLISHDDARLDSRPSGATENAAGRATGKLRQAHRPHKNEFENDLKRKGLIFLDGKNKALDGLCCRADLRSFDRPESKSAPRGMEMRLLR